MRNNKGIETVQRVIAGAVVLTLAMGAVAGAATSAGAAAVPWTASELSTVLTASSRPVADRDRDSDRKPAQLMTFLGVTRGMSTIDVIGLDGYLTEVLSVAVGPSGKVYLQNTAYSLQLRDGAVLKGVEARLANNRLSNVVRVDDSLPNPAIPPNSVDVAITAMNLHDVFNLRGMPGAIAFMKGVYVELKPGGVFGVVDHVGNDTGDNAKLHRMTRQQALDVAKASGFIVEAESNLYTNPADDHTKYVLDPSIRGKTDQFTLRLRKPT
jgi:predicted methyltransferase